MNGEESLLLNDDNVLSLNTRSYTLGRVLRFVAATSIFLVGFLGCHAHSVPFTNGNSSYLIRVKHGAVAAENKRCSDIGVDVLKDGGNAVDAAIAATFCVGVVNMFSSGIGGGGFMTVRLPPRPGSKSEVYSVDFRETAPALSNKTMFVQNPKSASLGGMSVAVPGEVRGLQEAHHRWGCLPWKRLVDPSAKLAAGWEVDKELAKRIQLYADLILRDPDWSLFAPDGKLLKEGEVIRRLNLSRTLSVIADEGPSAFYRGPIADSVIRKVRSAGGILSSEDLERYSVKVDRALEGTYRGRKVYTTHAPTSGPVLIYMLNLIEKYRLKARTGLNVHRLVEAMKFGFAARTELCDPAFANTTARIDEIPTKAYAELMVGNITDDRTHPPAYYKPVFDANEDHGTSHTSVLDKHGMAVSITSTINLVFGSQLMDSETGIILNDEMDDFSIPGVPNSFGLQPSPYNYPEPRKRPLSSIVPVILEHADGTFFLAIGGAGGSRIFPSVFQVLLNLDWGLDIREAIEFGRLHDQLYPLRVDAEDSYPKGILEDLRRRGHNVTVGLVPSVVQAVLRKDPFIYAASDSRKNGIAAGY